MTDMQTTGDSTNAPQYPSEGLPGPDADSGVFRDPAKMVVAVQRC